jgi:hypothetical protein
MPPFSLSDTQGSEVTPMKPSTISIALALSTFAALAEPLPVPKPPGPGGSCPFGYITSGSYCVPSQGGAQDAIAKPPNGNCPWGWISQARTVFAAGARGDDAWPSRFAAFDRAREPLDEARPSAPLSRVTCLPRRLRHGRRLGERRRRNEREQEGNGRFHWFDLCLGHYWDTAAVRR